MKITFIFTIKGICVSDLYDNNRNRVSDQVWLALLKNSIGAILSEYLSSISFNGHSVKTYNITLVLIQLSLFEMQTKHFNISVFGSYNPLHLPIKERPPTIVTHSHVWRFGVPRILPEHIDLDPLVKVTLVAQWVHHSEGGGVHGYLVVVTPHNGQITMTGVTLNHHYNTHIPILCTGTTLE